MSMGNQQAAKLQPNCYEDGWNALPSSPRIQIPRKRRRRTEGLFCTSKLQNNFKITAGALQVPQKARRLIRLRTTSPPTSGQWTPAARRRQVSGKETEEINTSSQVLKPVWRVKLPDVSYASLKSQNSPFSSRKHCSSSQKYSPTDSDTDLSEYDNEMYSTFVSSIEAKGCKTISQKYEERKVENVDVSFSLEASAQRLTRKIEEVEEIMRKVGVTSSEWIREGNRDGEQTQLASSWPGINTQPWLDGEGMESDKHRPLLVEERRVPEDAFSWSLQQVLTRGRGTAEGEEQRLMTKRPLTPPSRPHRFTSVAPERSSSQFLSAGGNVSPVASPALSLSVGPTTFSTSERLSPLLLSPLTPSLTGVTDEQDAEIPESHRICCNSSDDPLITLEAVDCKNAATVPGEAENNWMHSQEHLTESTIQLKEDYLHSSGRKINKCKNKTTPRLSDSFIVVLK